MNGCEGSDGYAEEAAAPGRADLPRTTCVTHDIDWNYTTRDELGSPVAAGGFTPSQWKIGGAFSGTRGFAAGVGSATWASRSASSIAPLMLSIPPNCAFCGDFLHPSKA